MGVLKRARCRARLLLALAAVCAPPAAALETDQFYAWTDPPRDATAAVNAKFQAEIEGALERVNAGRTPPSCHEVARRIMWRFRFVMFQNIEVWAMNTRLVERVPRTPEEMARYLDASIYGERGPIDIGMSIPPSPTIQVAGVLMGTDKLGHFVSSGWRYYERYRRARRRGLPAAEAEEHAIRTGILVERLILGRATSGVFSLGDLEANHAGMRFYRDLCEGDSPWLVLEKGRWRMARPFDISRYVGPEWDESYQPNVYAERRWRRVRPRLLAHCRDLLDPAVRARRAAYASRERETPTERIVAELVAEGRLPDPERFTIDRNCPEETARLARSLPEP
ncbi:MAG: hypothetical protein D6718_13130 [Acidobacteria bacterium]|nr:MAG: hypothetical protein D6718_13130 [Acidobacteriota bacterium]